MGRRVLGSTTVGRVRRSAGRSSSKGISSCRGKGTGHTRRRGRGHRGGGFSGEWGGRQRSPLRTVKELLKGHLQLQRGNDGHTGRGHTGRGLRVSGRRTEASLGREGSCLLRRGAHELCTQMQEVREHTGSSGAQVPTDYGCEGVWMSVREHTPNLRSHFQKLLLGNTPSSRHTYSGASPRGGTWER